MSRITILALWGALSSPAWAESPPPSADARVAELEAQLAAMQARLDALEKERATSTLQATLPPVSLRLEVEQEEAEQAAAEARAEAEQAAAEARAEAEEAALEARDAAEEAALEAREAAEDAAEEAREAAEDAAEEARGALGQPMVVAAGDVVTEAISMGGPLDVYGRVLGNAMSTGAPMTLHEGAEIEGDAVTIGADLRVLDGARVHGDAVSVGGEVEIEEGGEVDGDRVAVDSDETAPALGAMGVGGALNPMSLIQGAIRRFAILTAFAAGGVLTVGIWPRAVDGVSRVLLRTPGWYGMAGLVLALAGMTATSLVALTIIGLPLALAGVVVLGAAWGIGLVAVCSLIGERLPRVKEHGAWASFLAGAGVVAAIGLLPGLGTPLLVLLSLPGLGAALMTRFGTRV